MPLFGSSHKNDNKLEKPHPAERAGYNNAIGDVPVGAGAGAGAGGPGAGGPGAAGTGAAGMGNPAMGNNVGGGRHHHQAAAAPQTGMGNPGMRTDGLVADQQQYGAGGVGAGAGAGAGAGGAAIPPTGAINTQQQGRSGGGGAMTGKIEHAVGSMVGSNALKAKGLQKEQEAQGLKVQSTELAEAERLEREAGLRRERAVAHGAHPDNRHIGGTNPY
ncbi:hypothetical protein B0H11DRAFT_2055512 [Mycena galericulata]|nr:hypothetical protein B0H11DRAFT_337584 [Mycena galericulata]KAJ7461678.1 hypothetical protein B0H11DRAFT_2055512 [Mycena galericulata]